MHSTKLTRICPLCGNLAEFLGYGVIAPWIIDLLNTKIDPDTMLLECAFCEFKFYSHRYDEEEMKSIYNNYRMPFYLETRSRWEPWFRGIENYAYESTSNALIENRKKFFYLTMARAGLNVSVLHGCIDFGGDLGQFIPPEILGEKIVIDYSEKINADDSVRLYRSVNEVDCVVDLALCCHVLEHLPLIQPTIVSLAQKIREGGYIYIEVPQDAFIGSKFHKSISYRKWINFLVLHKRPFILIDFIGGVGRQIFGRLFWFGITKQSEHINYFGRASLEYLLKSSGFDVVYVSGSDKSLKQGRLKLGRLAIIGRKI
jgi:hypothetical protein